MYLFVEPPDEKRGTDGRIDEAVSLGEVSDRKFCSACQCSFESREEQVIAQITYKAFSNQFISPLSKNHDVQASV